MWILGTRQTCEIPKNFLTKLAKIWTRGKNTGLTVRRQGLQAGSAICSL